MDIPSFLGGAVLIVVAALCGLALLAIWLWALVHAIRNPAISDTNRLMWVIVILFANVLGAVLYLVIAPSPGDPPEPGGERRGGDEL